MSGVFPRIGSPSTLGLIDSGSLQPDALGELQSLHVLISLWQEQSAQHHFDSDLSLCRHSLQCARLAEVERASEAMIVAALFHEVGHLAPLSSKGAMVDHGAVGATVLAPWLLPLVTEPIRLQWPAIRYLCTVDPAYWASMSPGLRQACEEQGGTLAPNQVARFESTRFAPQAVQLCRWHQRARNLPESVPDLDRYTVILARQVIARQELERQSTRRQAPPGGARGTDARYRPAGCHPDQSRTTAPVSRRCTN